MTRDSRWRRRFPSRTPVGSGPAGEELLFVADTPPAGQTAGEGSDSAGFRNGEDPPRTLGNDVKCLFSNTGLWTTGRDQKSRVTSLL